MSKLKNLIDDAKDSLENISDDVKDSIENFVDDLKDTDLEKILNSNSFKKITSLLVSQNILGYSLLRYVVSQAANNSNSSGWQLVDNTLKAVDSNLENVLLINDENSSVTNIDASNAVNNLVLVGNTLSNLITAGSGSSSLWGGGEGNNTLQGGSSRDQFWYLGGGNDLITNFVTGMADNSDVAVLIGNLAKISREGETVSINFADGNSINLNTGSTSNDDVIMYSADGENIFGAKIADDLAKNLTYYSGANYFQLSQAGNLNVTDSENNNIWLDGSAGKIFSNIFNIDASTSTGENILAGDANSNQIIAGNGTSSLWGGAGNISDSLIGGSGQNIFWFGKNDGNDTISNAKQNDIVNLYDVSLSDLISADVSGNKISATFNTGNNLQINSAENLSATFKLCDGNFKFNHSTNSWSEV